MKNTDEQNNDLFLDCDIDFELTETPYKNDVKGSKMMSNPLISNKGSIWNSLVGMKCDMKSADACNMLSLYGENFSEFIAISKHHCGINLYFVWFIFVHLFYAFIFLDKSYIA